MARRLLEDYGFRAEMDHLAIFGLCHDCREAQAVD
jgi:Fe2+ or Zn2+ uptake regulation protein